MILLAVLMSSMFGLYLGASISQPMLLSKPAKSVLAQADQIDRALLDGLQDPRSITEDMRKLRVQIAKLPKGKGAEIAVDVDIIMEKLADQNANFQSKLWKAHEGVAKVREDLNRQGEASSDLPATIYDQLRRFFKWTGPVILLAIFIVSVLLLVPATPAWLAQVKEFAIGPISVARDVAMVKSSIRQSLEAIDAAVSSTYQQKSKQFDLDALFARLKLEIDKQFLSEFNVDLNKISHRATLYVPGMTDEQLVQATNYLPRPTINPDRPVVGRRFSVRYGIIGRTFRQRIVLYNWKVDGTRNRLVRLWGLTRGEAYKQGGSASSLMALPIPPDENVDPLGIIFLEAHGENLLMPGKAVSDLECEVQEDPNGRLTADKIAHDKIWEPLWSTGLVQPLYEALEAMKRELTWDTPLVGRDGQ
ncbi:hypothetical protein ASD67_04175 [Sphingopyxis sp. Root1497]|nr:hypothetical protein ASD67_04175 [Sphingopyxis sp. Root1497]